MGYETVFLGQDPGVTAPVVAALADDAVLLEGTPVIDYTHFSLTMSRSRPSSLPAPCSSTSPASAARWSPQDSTAHRHERALLRQDAVVALTAPEFVSLLLSGVPESSTTVREHLDEQEDELLLHLLVADLRRLAIAWFEEGRADALARLLDVLNSALREGDEYVENAIAASFVEDLGWWGADMEPFITTLPGELANEVERQRHSSK